MESGEYDKSVRLFSQTPIYLEAKRLLVMIIAAVKNFPREARYTVGQDLQRSAAMSLRYLAKACVVTDRTERLRAIEDFQADFEYVKALVEISFEEKWLAKSVLAKLLPPINSVGRQGSAWKRSQKGTGQNRQG